MKFSPLKSPKGMLYLARKFEFEASHFYRNFGGKVENLHGHNYEIWVMIRGDTNEHDMIINVSDLKRLINPIISHYDHRLLNNLPEFQGINPTVEVISEVIFNRASEVIDNLFAVKVYEDYDIFGAFDGEYKLGVLKGVKFQCDDYWYEVWVKGDINERGIVENIDKITKSKKKFFERYTKVIDGSGYLRLRGEKLDFKTYRFSSSHVLGIKDLTYDENLKIYGKCARKESHGHNYRLIIFSNDKGSFKIAKDIVDTLDHNHLNDYIDNPTLENIAKYIYLSVRCDILKIYETPKTYVIISENYEDIISVI